MYHLIVFLPLLGAILAGLIALNGARRRNPGAVGPLDPFHHPALSLTTFGEDLE